MEHLLRSLNNQLKYKILINNSLLVHEGEPSIYQVHTKVTSISGDIRKCQLGTFKPGLKEKVIMMVGKTGTGKSTMINAMFNHVVGVKLEDLFRFRLVDESVQARTLTQADSQTDTITAYTLHHQDGFAVPYTLTIVDTPGFGDTRGKEQDKELIEKMRIFFTTAGKARIDHIDVLGFVIKATDARLTENQKYIFDSVRSIWGNNIEEPIFMIFNFADQNPPNAFEALDSAKFPYEKGKCFKFNNSALFGKGENEIDKMFAELYWEMNADGFHQFLMEHLIKARPKSITLFQAILEGIQLKQQLMKNSTLVHPGSWPIYQIHTQDTSISGDIRKCQLGTAKPGSTEKVVMMVGATGSGKTTMINAMFNYVVNVKLKDQFRFRLIDESVQAVTLTQASSQTDTITAYTLHHQDGFAVPYTLTIVDTPGFDDTRGKEQDKKTTEQIRLFFTNTGDAGIDHIDVLGFVVKANDARLTESQKYIFNYVLSLWGNNIKGNIFMFFPFSDMEPPAALVALKSANIPYEKEKCYTFNNARLFQNGQRKREKQQAEINWEMNAEGFHKFLIEHLEKAEPKSLILSQSVLDIRCMLEICQKENKEYIQNMVFEQEQLVNKRNELVNGSKIYYFYEEIRREWNKVSVQSRATNCSKCARTCHYPCKAKFIAFFCTIFKRNLCDVCFCSYKAHIVQDFIYEREYRTIIKINEDFRKQFLDLPKEERMRAEHDQIYKLKFDETNLEAAQKLFFGQVMVKRLFNETLNKIALQPADETAGWKERDYIEQMIQREENEGKEGWRERIQQFRAVLQRSDDLSHEWNREFVQIIPEYKVDPKLSTQDNDICKELKKIVHFKKNVQMLS